MEALLFRFILRLNSPRFNVAAFGDIFFLIETDSSPFVVAFIVESQGQRHRYGAAISIAVDSISSFGDINDLSW